MTYTPLADTHPHVVFLAPYRSVQEAVARGYLGELNPTPWVFMTGNTIGWIVYSFLRHNLFLFFANAPGFLLSVWFNLCAAKLQYEDHHAREIRQSIVRYLEEETSQLFSHKQSTATLKTFMRQEGVETDKADADAAADEGEADDHYQTSWQAATDLGALVLSVTAQTTPAPAPHEKMVMIIVIIWTILVAIVGLANLPSSTNELVIGISVNINLFFFYGAPLSSVVKVCRDRNSASIHIRTMVTNTLNSCFWTAYGLAIGDAFIFVPNGIGAVLGFMQIALVLLFPRKPFDGPLKSTVGTSEKSSRDEAPTEPSKDMNPSSAVPNASLGAIEGKHDDGTNQV